jgi:large subunit ribosomal protein L15
MELHNLKKLKKDKGKKRVGRGIGSGKGGHTVGKGQKGQKSRSGKKPNLGFEGGQTPLYKKLPKIGGFKSFTFKETYIIDLDVLNSFKDGDEVTPQKLVEKKILKEVPSGGVKILSDGDLKKKVELKGFKFSKKAKEKIESSGAKINA